MGDKRASIRTLSTGEQVTHYPDGREVLLQPRNTLAGILDADTEQQEAASDALRDQLIDVTNTKREKMEDGDSVPSDKRPI